MSESKSESESGCTPTSPSSSSSNTETPPPGPSDAAIVAVQQRFAVHQYGVDVRASERVARRPVAAPSAGEPDVRCAPSKGGCGGRTYHYAGCVYGDHGDAIPAPGSMQDSGATAPTRPLPSMEAVMAAADARTRQDAALRSAHASAHGSGWHRNAEGQRVKNRRDEPAPISAQAREATEREEWVSEYLLPHRPEWWRVDTLPPVSPEEAAARARDLADATGRPTRVIRRRTIEEVVAEVPAAEPVTTSGENDGR